MDKDTIVNKQAEQWIKDYYKGQPVPLFILEKFRNMTTTEFLKIILEAEQ